MMENKTIDVFDVELNNPHAIIQQKLVVEMVGEDDINYLDALRKVIYFKEFVATEEFRWKYTNKYWIDPLSGRVLRSQQVIHPEFPRLEIFFYYK